MAEMRTLFLVHDRFDVERDAQDDQVAGQVGGAAHVEHIRVIEGNLLRNLHHTKDDDQVRSGEQSCQHSVAQFHASWSDDDQKLAQIFAYIWGLRAIVTEFAILVVNRGRQKVSEGARPLCDEQYTIVGAGGENVKRKVEIRGNRPDFKTARKTRPKTDSCRSNAGQKLAAWRGTGRSAPLLLHGRFC